MTSTTAREALIVEAIGDAAKLIRQVEALEPKLDESCRALLLADATVRDSLAGFEGRMMAVSENAKTRTVQHVAARINEAAARSIETQSRAMAEAARAAFGTELGPTIRQLQSALTALVAQRQRYWESWLTHLAVAVTASTATWFLALRLLGA